MNRALLLGIASLLILAVGVLAALPVRPAYACTGSVDDLTLNHFALTADAIAVVDVSEVGGAENETPPLPPGAPIRSGVSTAAPVPDGFHFAGYRATAQVTRLILGPLPAQVTIDEALRVYLEGIVRRWEAGERLVPCFFGSQHRYQVDRSYLVFLSETDVGWNTMAALPVEGNELVLAVGQEAMPLQRKHLIVGEDLFTEFFISQEARNSGPAFTQIYGDLWFIEQRRVPLDTVLAAVASLRPEASITPPMTGDGGLR